MNIASSSSGAGIRIRPDMPVTPDHSAEVAAAILVRGMLCRTQRAETQHLVVGGEKRPLPRALFGADHVLPAPVGEKPMIAAGDQLGPVFEHDSIRLFAGRPMRLDSRLHIAPIATTANGAVDLIANLQIGDWSRRTVSQ